MPSFGLETCTAQVRRQYRAECALISAESRCEGLEGFSANLSIGITQNVVVPFGIKPDLLIFRLHARPGNVGIHKNVVNIYGLLAQGTGRRKDRLGFRRQAICLSSQN